ncbi:type I 3-dehydroquinate dehydratase [Aquifex aeolicus]|uniref:3-dehydroquinate dehydratase n=1 Tax=Aquifex aeolicus (strain VF5) TaxID=224324 RepID=AROD_AQUAE|nr:type I 3-dehydroquinate dehydratase [Aquifex aeolicus]O66440.1 RecName: Full=3-dehydroquinate dehydratase; Short=3-dehydroquinase; AltName: Full=Type I DHQase; AltName: Full=Type I dehydroquinase; Short=DHQ1 [Aquifex aeolicus VF5]2EGZ_A Chain A, 3-dehydroquinate dehydratase [Aquifex aeolicus]2EGZ_C Chain C, 3-dehydroquinate dehydratase [Aquifex aeolicus]2YSW_A Chain A, 3-dehydroquinate dehydratase [Aquifex aeolicus VF5]2YSW_B Chain B, 3-dehydroquinate dehydratase [Aquifex aeolicus VF5]2YSW
MLIAVPLDDTNFSENLKKAKEKGADIVELRVDQFSDTSLNYVKEKLEEVHSQGLKTILTIRSPEEGGREVKNREELFEELSPLSDYTDIELSSRGLLVKLYNITKEAGKKLIISYHNFELTPPNWIIREVLREGYRYGGIPKIAVKANSYEDVARLLCISRQVEGEKILISMGDYGKISRLAGYVFGSVITYCSLEKAFAPGQIPLEEMVELRKKFYRL